MMLPTTKIDCRPTSVIKDSAPSAASIATIVEALRAVPKGKLAIVVDYQTESDDAVDALTEVAEKLDAHVYSGAMHVRGNVDPTSATFHGGLSSATGAIRELLRNYDTMLLLGCKTETFLWTGEQAIPEQLKVIHISPVHEQLGADFPCDMAVVGHLKATLEAISNALGSNNPLKGQKRDLGKVWADIHQDFSRPDGDPANLVLLEILKQLNLDTYITVEGSSKDVMIQNTARSVGFRCVRFSPRGGGLGYAMPVAVGIALAHQKHSICFVGDGGSMYSIHSIYTAARHKVPVIFICFVNHEYRILKELQCRLAGSTMENTHFVGLDFNDPPIGVESIATGFGAQTLHCASVKEVKSVLATAMAHKGPTMIFVPSKP